MDPQRRQDRSLPERKGQKRKLNEDLTIKEEQQHKEGEISSSVPSSDARQAILAEVRAQVKVLDSAFSWLEADRAASKRATHVLAELAKNGPYFRNCILILHYLQLSHRFIHAEVCVFGCRGGGELDC